MSRLQLKDGGEGDDPAATMQLPLALLEEKNQEIDHLNEQILHLQQEVDASKDNKVGQRAEARTLLRGFSKLGSHLQAVVSQGAQSCTV